MIERYCPIHRSQGIFGDKENTQEPCSMCNDEKRVPFGNHYEGEADCPKCVPKKPDIDLGKVFADPKFADVIAEARAEAGNKQLDLFTEPEPERTNRPVCDDPFCNCDDCTVTKPAPPKDELVVAAEGLLQYIRELYPRDFKPGGQGFICKHHIAIDNALAKRRK